MLGFLRGGRDRDRDLDRDDLGDELAGGEDSDAERELQEEMAAAAMHAQRMGANAQQAHIDLFSKKLTHKEFYNGER